MSGSLEADVPVLLALRKLDLIDPAGVVAWASEVLAAGQESEALVNLAAVVDLTAANVDSLLFELSTDLGIATMSDELVGRTAAAHVARRLELGELQPIEVAREIWRIAALDPAAEPALRPFIALASE